MPNDAAVMKVGAAHKISNMLLSGLAGVASFIFSLYVFITITQLASMSRSSRAMRFL